MKHLSKNDWRAYASYLQSQIEGKDLKKPKSIGEAFNSFNIVQDLDDVNNTKIYVKS